MSPAKVEIEPWPIVRARDPVDQGQKDSSREILERGRPPYVAGLPFALSDLRIVKLTVAASFGKI